MRERRPTVGTSRTGSSSFVAGEPLRDWEGAANYLNVTPRLIRELWARRELGGVKVGRHVRFRVADLDAYIENHRVEPQR
jgi:excisionase family DNA binding protein